MVEPTAPVDEVAGDPDARFQIGEVARRTGVTQRTLRFYEERGLLTPSDRMEGGFRLYSEADIERIRMIKRLQDLLGFKLAEIKELVEAEEVRAQLRATQRPGRDLPERRERVELVRNALRTQLDVVEPKLEQLEAMKSQLRERLASMEERLEQIDEAMATGRPLPDPADARSDAPAR